MWNGMHLMWLSAFSRVSWDICDLSDVTVPVCSSEMHYGPSGDYQLKHLPSLYEKSNYFISWRRGLEELVWISLTGTFPLWALWNSVSFTIWNIFTFNTENVCPKTQIKCHTNNSEMTQSIDSREAPQWRQKITGFVGCNICYFSSSVSEVDR